MDTWILGAAFGPLLAAFLFGVIGVGIRLFIARNMPPCWLKDQLLAERFKTPYSAANGRIAHEVSKRLGRSSKSIAID